MSGDVIPVSPIEMTRLTSPNFPDEYPHSSIMTWVFRVPPPYHFNINFDVFKLAEGLDKLSIGNGTAPFAAVSEVFSVGESATDVASTRLDDLRVMEEYMWIKLESFQFAKHGSFAFDITAVIGEWLILMMIIMINNHGNENEIISIISNIKK